MVIFLVCSPFVFGLIIYMEKFLDSDWLTAVQFRCNTSAKSMTPVQKVKHRCKLHIAILNYDWLKTIGIF